MWYGNGRKKGRQKVMNRDSCLTFVFGGTWGLGGGLVLSEHQGLDQRQNEPKIAYFVNIITVLA